jgi:NAD(P)-dependent dehydrogenase (short-subunit alcohol dehydrogenase family)
MPTTLITGCDRGLGAALAHAYARDGWRVVATCLDPANVPHLESAHSNIRALQLDVSDFGRIAAVADELREEPIDLLLSNAAAGINFLGGHNPSFGSLDYDRWLTMFRVNTLGAVCLAERFVEHVARSEQRKMVFVSSRMGSIQFNRAGGGYGYRSTKAALNACVRSLSVDLLSRRIVVLAVHPGNARTYSGKGTLEVDQSVAGLQSVIERTNLEETGSFIAWDGSFLPW